MAFLSGELTCCTDSAAVTAERCLPPGMGAEGVGVADVQATLMTDHVEKVLQLQRIELQLEINPSLVFYT